MTWQGAFHHIMNKGINEEKIFADKELKSKYLELIEEKSKTNKIRIFAYCIMDNHYHLVLENSSSKLSEFMKNLNSQYGFYYRKVKGGKGYVFQDRFKSILIQNESYLLNAILYVVQNPVKAKCTERFNDYPWSSGSLYFSGERNSFIDVNFVESIFSNKEKFFMFLGDTHMHELDIKKSKFGQILGDEAFIMEAEKKYDRREEDCLKQNKRVEDQYFQPVEKIIFEFQHKNKIKIEDIDRRTYEGKRLRGEFLVLLTILQKTVPFRSEFI
jgi:REP element-mobilizing transposase RayT